MNKQELLDRINDLEWEDFEVKAAKAEVPKDVWSTVSAFSNTNGGWIVLGVKQIGKTFEIAGLTNPEKIEQDFINTLRGEKFNAKITPIVNKYSFDDKYVFAFYIPLSKDKPVYYNTLANTFIRKGSSDQKATKEEIDAMYRDASFGTKTTRTVDGTSARDLHKLSVDRFLEYMSRFNPTFSYNKLTKKEVLRKLKIIVDDKLTYSGLLMFGQRDVIENHFPDFRIDLLEIPADSYKNAEPRYTYRIDEHENLWDYYFSLFERLIRRIDRPFQLTKEGFAIDDYPYVRALREALVNMLMHADYFSLAASRIRIFTTYIEFYNPGGLPKSLSEILKADFSMPRNPIIAKVFRVVKLAENAGFGFDKMINGWKEYAGLEPIFETDFDSYIVKFYFKSRHNISSVRSSESSSALDHSLELSNNQIKILKLVDVSSKITIANLAVELAVSSRTIENNISKLKAWGFLWREGASKNGNWIVKMETSEKESLFAKISSALSSELYTELSSEPISTFYRKLNLHSELSNIQIKILKLMDIRPEITIDELSIEIRVTTRTIEKNISKIKALGLLLREGASKNGIWIIKL
ncbi:MAG: RNA-binding domain-containing protein [Marinifilaceae bacterium]